MRLADVGIDGTKVWMPRLEIHVSDGCNYACQFCNHVVPFIGGRRYEVEDYRPWVEQLWSRGVRWDVTCLTGGEPWMNKKLVEFVRAFRGYPCLEIVTNLAVWLRDESSLDKHAEILGGISRLVVSRYPPYVEKFGLDRINNLLDQIRSRFGIQVTSFVDGTVREFGKVTFTEEPLPVVETGCPVQDCSQLFADGRIGRCTYTRGVGTEGVSEGFSRAVEWFDLSKPWTVEEFALWRGRYPLSACSHCSIAQGIVEFVPWQELV